MNPKTEPPEIEAAEKRITQPLRAGRGWVVRERKDGKWIDHPQVRWHDALAAVRRMRAETAVRLALHARGLKEEDWPDACPWAGEMAETEHADWKRAARHVIAVLPFGDHYPTNPPRNPDSHDSA